MNTKTSLQPPDDKLVNALLDGESSDIYAPAIIKNADKLIPVLQKRRAEISGKIHLLLQTVIEVERAIKWAQIGCEGKLTDSNPDFVLYVMDRLMAWREKKNSSDTVRDIYNEILLVHGTTFEEAVDNILTKPFGLARDIAKRLGQKPDKKPLPPERRKEVEAKLTALKAEDTMTTKQLKEYKRERKLGELERAILQEWQTVNKKIDAIRWFKENFKEWVQGIKLSDDPKSKAWIGGKPNLTSITKTTVKLPDTTGGTDIEIAWTFYEQPATTWDSYKNAVFDHGDNVLLQTPDPNKKIVLRKRDNTVLFTITRDPSMKEAYSEVLTNKPYQKTTVHAHIDVDAVSQELNRYIEKYRKLQSRIDKLSQIHEPGFPCGLTDDQRKETRRILALRKEVQQLTIMLENDDAILTANQTHEQTKKAEEDAAWPTIVELINNVIRISEEMRDRIQAHIPMLQIQLDSTEKAIQKVLETISRS